MLRRFCDSFALSYPFVCILGLFVALFVYILSLVFSPWKMKTKGSYLNSVVFVVAFVVLSLFFVTGDPGTSSRCLILKASHLLLCAKVWKVSAELIGEDPVLASAYCLSASIHACS